MTPSPSLHPAVHGAALVVVAAASCGALLATHVPSPPLGDAQAFLAFVETEGAIGTAIIGIRALAIIAAAYVGLISLLALLLSIGTPASWMERAAHAVTLPALRRLLPGMVGFGSLALSASATAPIVAAQPPVGSTIAIPTGSTPTSRHDDEPISTPPPEDDLLMLAAPSFAKGTDPDTDPARGTATFSYEGPAGPTTTSDSSATTSPRSNNTDLTRSTLATATSHPSTTTPSPRPPSSRRSVRRSTSEPADRVSPPPIADPAVAVTPPTPPNHASPPRLNTTWTVEHGDHLWHIAEATLAARTGHQPTAAATSDYWNRLIGHNQDRLIDPSNADLILPGQVLALPAH